MNVNIRPLLQAFEVAVTTVVVVVAIRLSLHWRRFFFYLEFVEKMKRMKYSVCICASCCFSVKLQTVETHFEYQSRDEHKKSKQYSLNRKEFDVISFWILVNTEIKSLYMCVSSAFFCDWKSFCTFEHLLLCYFSSLFAVVKQLNKIS